MKSDENKRLVLGNGKYPIDLDAISVG